MLTGTGSLSLRKKDLDNQKIPTVGYRKTAFAHKATAGATGINLTALTTPSELTANGFSQPSVGELTNAQLLFYRNNLKLISSARGALIDYVSYTVASSTQINFVGFTALENEIFYGVIDYNALTGLKVVDASPIIATGTLTLGTTDFNVGVPFKVGQYSGQNVGAVLVFVDRVLQQRNTSNSSSSLDKDYYEVDTGAGIGTIIRFNTVDPTLDREVTVVSNGILSERPDGSMMAVIESLSGYVDNISTVVAQLSGLASSTVKGAAPTNVDLVNFGNRVLTLETNRARIDQSNTWTASQPLIGSTNGSAAGAGEIGELKTSVLARGAGANASTGVIVDLVSVVLTPGRWRVTGYASNSGSAYTIQQAFAWLSDANATATLPSGNEYLAYMMSQNITPVVVQSDDLSAALPTRYFQVSTNTTIYLSGRWSFTAGTVKPYGRLTAERY